jgi:O-antigen/teichoic acid export membrane protein
MALLGGYGLWWILGIGAFIWPVAAVAMAIVLLQTPRVEVPPGFGAWVLFILWTLASAMSIANATDAMTFGYRVLTYLAGTVILLYVVNLPRREPVTRSIVHALMGFFVVVLIGGYLGVLIPHTSFNSVFERLLPHVVGRSGFLQQLVHPQIAQKQTWLHHARPSAPFPFSNMWGGVMGMLLPFAFLEFHWARSALRRLCVAALLVAAILPIMRTADRGLWVSLGIAAVYVAIRRALRGRIGLLVSLLFLVGIFAIDLALNGSLLANVTAPFQRNSSNEARTYLYQQSIAQALQHPLFGSGVPLRPPSRNLPYIGTQGQAWLVLVTSGFPALLFFLWWYLSALWRSRRIATDVVFAAHVSLLIFLVHLPIYDMLPTEFVMSMIVAGLLLRDPSTRRQRATVIPRPPPPPRPLIGMGRPAGDERSAGGVLMPLPPAPPWSPPPPARVPAEAFEPTNRRAAAQAAPAEAAAGGADIGALARHSSLNLVGNVVSAILGFALVFVVARGLGTTGAGVFFLAVAIFTVVVSVSLMGADIGLIRQVAAARATGRQGDIGRILRIALWPVFCAATIAAAAVYLFAPNLAALVVHGANPVAATRFIRVLAPFIPLAAVTTAALGATRGFGSMAAYNLVENFGKPMARPLLILGAVAFGLSGTWIALGWAVPVIAGLVVTIAYLARLTHRASAARASAEAGPRQSTAHLAAEFWKFSAPRWAGAVFQVTLIWLDVLLVGAMRSAQEAGIYGTASRFITAGTFALQAVGFAIAPQIGALMARGDRAGSERLYRVATCWLVIVSWPVYLLLAVFAPVVLGLFGEGFTKGQTAMMILALATLVNVGTGNVTFVLLMAGRSTWNLANQAAALVVNVALNLILIPRIGIAGAAIAWGAAILLENGLPMIQVHRGFDIHPFGRGYLVATAGAVGCFGILGLVLRAVLGPTLITLFATLCLGAIGYLALLSKRRHDLELPAMFAALRIGRRPRGRHRRTRGARSRQRQSASP